MKALPWLRLYTEIIDDEKLGLLAFEDRWHFVALLCLKGKGVLDSEPDMEMLWRKVAFKMGLTGAELEKVVARLSRMSLIDRETLQPVAWDKRQMQSDTDPTAADRKRKQREREKLVKKSAGAINSDVTTVSRVTVTDVTRTDTDTDTDKDKEEAKAYLSASKLPACPHIEILSLFAKHLPELPQPKPELWEGQRAKNLASRWKWCLTTKSSKTNQPYATDKASALDWFDRFFAYVAKSDFLTGRNGQWTGCDLAWLTKAENFAKVLQGNYENKGAA